MMKIPYSCEQLMEAQKEVVRANKLESLLPASDRVLRLGKDGRVAARRRRACRHRRLALGRLPR